MTVCSAEFAQLVVSQDTTSKVCLFLLGGVCVCVCGGGAGWRGCGVGVGGRGTGPLAHSLRELYRS